MQEEINVEEVEEWTPSATAEDLECLFRCHPALLGEVQGGELCAHN